MGGTYRESVSEMQSKCKTSSRTHDRRAAVLRAVRELTHGYGGVPPSVRLVSDTTGIPRSSVYRAVQYLVENELVEIGVGRRAGIRLIARDDCGHT